MKRKLNSERGVALAFVIAAFAVVMVLGTVGITAGYANLSKAFDRKDGKQAYYTLISAARLLREELDGAAFTVTETKTVTEVAETAKTEETTERTVSYTPDAGLAKRFLSRFANDLPPETETLRVEKGDYTRDITWEVRVGAPCEDETEALTMLLSCDGRTVSMEAYFDRSELPEELFITNDGVCYRTKTTYTLTIGAIHEEAS